VRGRLIQGVKDEKKPARRPVFCKRSLRITWQLQLRWQPQTLRKQRKRRRWLLRMLPKQLVQRLHQQRQVLQEQRQQVLQQQERQERLQQVQA